MEVAKTLDPEKMDPLVYELRYDEEEFSWVLTDKFVGMPPKVLYCVLWMDAVKVSREAIEEFRKAHPVPVDLAIYDRTDELVRDSASEFLFMLAAPRLDGTVQSIINPIANR